MGLGVLNHEGSSMAIRFYVFKHGRKKEQNKDENVDFRTCKTGE
jgi:hypothetical protein